MRSLRTEAEVINVSGQEEVVGFKAKMAARKAARAQRRAEEAAAAAARWAEEGEQAMTWAKYQLVNAPGGGAAVLAYRELETLAKRYYPDNAGDKVAEAIAEAEFDRSRFASPRYGVVTVVTGGALEIFRDWVIFGKEAHDIEPTTRADVYTDGSIQVSTVVVQDRKGRDRVVNQEHDMRTAHLQLTSSSWSMSVPISPDTVNEVRRYAAQLNGHVETLKPRAASSDDIQEMVRTILSRTDQPPAEKIKQLSLLRFDHLLSDQQFEQARAKILDL